LAIIAVFGYLATFISHPLLPVWSKYLLWPLYWYAQGSVMTGIWVLAHECGHQSFSESEFANNLIGTVLHSLLLVPFHSWRITHGRHHNNTGSCENDEVFAPATRADWGAEMMRETPLSQGFGIVKMLLVGWPAYLLLNVTGPAKYRGKNASHFSPAAVFFEEKDRPLVRQTVAAWVACIAVLAAAIAHFGTCFCLADLRVALFGCEQ
jgi:omega-6 fatty acid desaturase (delta-12 desaturase)